MNIYFLGFDHFDIVDVNPSLGRLMSGTVWGLRSMSVMTVDTGGQEASDWIGIGKNIEGHGKKTKK